jgi:hypothetical protein
MEAWKLEVNNLMYEDLIPKSLFGHHPEEKKEIAFLNWLNEDNKKRGSTVSNPNRYGSWYSDN